MGIDTKKFTVYSIKHSAISYLVKQGVDIKVLEKAMHYKQKNNTTINHYAVKEGNKSVGLLLAKATASKSNNNGYINKDTTITLDNPYVINPGVNKVLSCTYG
jgi:hypothetical protein